jgi:hypothetical protein
MGNIDGVFCPLIRFNPCDGKRRAEYIDPFLESIIVSLIDGVGIVESNSLAT